MSREAGKEKVAKGKAALMKNWKLLL